jgi:uncharacterized delta-60 repeat protein
MKRLFLLFAPFFFFQINSIAQTVKMDSSFSDDGFVRPVSVPGSMYCHPLDVHPNGNIWLGGFGVNPFGLKVTVFSPAGDSINAIRYHFLSNVGNGAPALKVDKEGRIVFNNGSSQLWRCLADGSRDTTFGESGIAPMPLVLIRELDFNAEGKIYAAGDYLNSDKVAVLAFTPDGEPDSTFSDDGVYDFQFELNGTYLFYCMKVQADGKILVSGFSYFGGNDRPAILIRLNPDGTLDQTFADEGILLEYLTGISEGYSLAVQPDQKILMGGYTLPDYMGTVTRYLPTGQRDPSFGESGVVYLPQTYEILDVIVQPDGKLLLYAWVPIAGNVDGTALVQLLPNGSLDPNFGTNGIFVSPNTDAEPPMDISMIGNNKVVAMSAKSFFKPNSVTHLMALQQFILDFNVGVLQPNNTLDEAQVLLYPNPVSQHIQLQFELQNPETLDIELMDLSGKILQTVHQHQRFEAGKQEVSIPVSDALPAGTYLLNIAGQGKVLRSVRWVKG